MLWKSILTNFRNDKPLQQYFKPLIIDHLSFIHNEKQCQPSSFKNSKYCDRGKKVTYSPSYTYIKKTKLLQKI